MIQNYNKELPKKEIVATDYKLSNNNRSTTRSAESLTAID
jgi:hypothetical protein